MFALSGFPQKTFAAERTEASLLRAWEDAQRHDPKTRKFEKISDGKYHFETTRFPYVGTLDVLTLNIEPGDSDHWTEGVVEVELPSFSERDKERYDYSYNAWQDTNALYYDDVNREWITNQERETIDDETEPKNSSSSWRAWTSAVAPLVLFVVFMGWMGWRSRSMAAMARENTRYLKEILDVLKNQSK